MARLPKGITLTGRLGMGHNRVLTPDAATFVATLHRNFEAERQRLLAHRATRAAQFAKGGLPDFPAETAAIRAGAWKVAPLPADLQDRRVEIVAPPERKPMITALNSGARVFVADFEDALSPTWDNLLDGQLNLMDRWTSAMDYTDPATGRRYALGQKPAVLMVRPRGWHRDEVHMKVDGKPVAGALFDFGLYVFHNARTALAKGSGPYVSLAKLEGHLEARLWNAVFVLAQSLLGLPLGTIKATALIETLPAVFEMEEIAYELRDHLTALGCGRSNLIFSFIKTLAGQRSAALPDRSRLDGSTGFIAAHEALLIRTCHRRGCLAIGGTAAQLPNRKDPEANALALADIRLATEGAARNGQDGICVAHPDLVPLAAKVFNDLMPTPNQIYVSRDDVKAGRKDLLEVHAGSPTEPGIRHNIRVCVQYLEAWLRGRGSLVVDHVLVDSAAAEAARSQLWQWLKLGAKLDGGAKLTRTGFDRCLSEEMLRLRGEAGAEAFARTRFKEAAAILKTVSVAAKFEAFLTAAACRKLG